MSPTAFLNILYARRGLILMMVLLSTLAAVIVTLATPKTYKATTSLVVNYKGTDSVTGLVLPSQLTPAFMATQIDIISNVSTALKVVDQLKLTDHAEVYKKFEAQTNGQGDIREWQAQQLLRKLDVSPSRESNLLKITFSAAEPQQAASIANAFASSYEEMSVHLRVDPSRKAAAYFNDQIKELRNKFEEAQRKVAAYQQQNGIVSVDQNFDVETLRLNELSNRLALAQTQTMEAVSRRTEVSGRQAHNSPDVAANPIVQDLRMKLTAAEAKLAVLSETLTENHPQFKAAEREVQVLRNDLRNAINSSALVVTNNARILERHEAELNDAVQAQIARVMDANKKRGELKVLSHEMESAQRSYEMAAQRFMQANLEGQSNLTDISVLTPATPPLKHAAPRARLNLLFALGLGLMLGVGLAVLAEIVDRRIRSRHDLADLLEAPVFEIVNRTKSRQLASPAMLLPYGHVSE